MNTAVTDEKKHYTPTLQLHPKPASSKLHAVEEDLVPVARTIWKITLTSELRLMLAWQARPNLHTGLSSNRNLHSIRRLSSTPLMLHFERQQWEYTCRQAQVFTQTYKSWQHQQEAGQSFTCSSCSSESTDLALTLRDGAQRRLGSSLS